MIKVLKIALILWGIIHIFLGLSFIFIPGQIAVVMGFEKLDNSSIYLGALCGLTFVAAAVWLIIAAKDPIHNIKWVNFAVLWSALGVAIQVYLVITGVIGLGQAAYGLIQDSIFTLSFLVFYPYRSLRAG
jgi:hypothetical protein